MEFYFCVYLGAFFVLLAHSTLLHFFIEDYAGTAVLAREIIFPVPSKGKFVSVLAFAIGNVCFVLALMMLPLSAKEIGEFGRSLPIAIAFVLVPLGIYATFIFRRLKRANPASRSSLIFDLKPGDHRENQWVMVAVAVLGGVSLIVKLLK